MSTLSVEFAFEIGEFVYLKTADHFDGARPRKFIITEQIAERCPGGIQLHYRLGGLECNVLEICLTRDEPPYVPMTDEAVQDHLRALVAEQEEIRTLLKRLTQ